MKFLIMQFSPASCDFLPLGPNILLRTMFLSAHNLFSFSVVRYVISHFVSIICIISYKFNMKLY